jgi:hypothetical protein
MIEERFVSTWNVCQSAFSIVSNTLARSFDDAAETGGNRFPKCMRGRTTLIAVDLGGAHAGQLFETYSFLVLDIDTNQNWVLAQRGFRSELLPSMRRISFKSLNDRVRRRAITPFLQMGNMLAGWLVTFAITKNRESIFEIDEVAPELGLLLSTWKPAVRERLLRVLHLSAFLMSGLCKANQNVLWVVDEDAIASNVDQLTKLTKLLASIYSAGCETQLGHLRCATAKSDDGSRSLEDLLAYSDLAAGAVCEITTAMAGTHRNLQSTIMAPLPRLLSWKARHICSWLAFDESPLRRLTCLIELNKDKPGMRTQIIRWHAVPGVLDVPPVRNGLS